MTIIKPCAELRNNYNKISKICHATNEPVFITKNGHNDLVILSHEAYENLLKNHSITEEERIDNLISEQFDKHFCTFEEFEKNLFEHIDIACKEIKDGKYQYIEDFCSEMEDIYGFDK